MAGTSVVPSTGSNAPESSRDPLSKIIEIAKDPDLTDSDKSALIDYAKNKFVNRRRMAYIALIAIVVSLIFLLLAAIHDGTSECVAAKTCMGIMGAISENQTLISWIEGFLTSIVAAYYGISAWRPAS
ncbi:MAG: hypothetical protein AAF434_19045 [Pseudomonadota bacterium]